MQNSPKSSKNSKSQKNYKNTSTDVKSPIILTNPIHMFEKFKKDFTNLDELNKQKIIDDVSEYLHNFQKKYLIEKIKKFILEQINFFQKTLFDLDVIAQMQNLSKNDKDSIHNLVKGQLINPEIDFVSKTLGVKCICKLKVEFRYFTYYFECDGNYKNFLDVNTEYVFENDIFNEQEKKILSSTFDSHYIEQESTSWMLEYNKILQINDDENILFK